MPIISISRGSFHRGREVAHKVAEILRYESISRDSLLENSEVFDIPEIKLMPNVKHAAHILERFSFGRDRYINYMASSLLRFLQKDNHIYHGLAGQFFVQGVSHVIKVRIIADIEDRVAAEVRRKGISADVARQQLMQDDEERRKWAMLLYGIDISEPENYDIVLNISTMGVGEAAELVARTAQFDCYQATEESTRYIHELTLKSEVKAALFDYPQAAVAVEAGHVRVQVKIPQGQRETVRKRMENSLADIYGVTAVEIQISDYY